MVRVSLRRRIASSFTAALMVAGPFVPSSAEVAAAERGPQRPAIVVAPARRAATDAPPTTVIVPATIPSAVALKSVPSTAASNVSSASSFPSSPATTKPGALDPALLASISQTVRSILVESVPERIEQNKNWGDTRERFSQLKLKSDSGKLRFEANTKEVKHGLWKQVVVVPVDPQNNLRFRIVEARSVGPGTLEFEVVASSPLKLTARVERWRTGVKMFNVSTDAEAAIEMRVVGTVTHEHREVDGKRYLMFRPVIQAVDLQLAEFDLRRLGPADGPLVAELGDMLSDPLADQLDKQEPKVAVKLNAAITKKQDKLRLPLSLPVDFSGWSWGGKKKMPTTAEAKPTATTAAVIKP